MEVGGGGGGGGGKCGGANQDGETLGWGKSDERKMGGGGNGNAVSGSGKAKLGNKWWPLNDFESDGDENEEEVTVDGIEWLPPKLLCTIITMNFN